MSASNQGSRSFIHSLDPSAKLIGFFAVMGLPLVFNDPRYVAGVGVLVFAIAVLGGCAGIIMRSWRVYLILIIFNTALWQLYAPGTTVLARWGVFKFTRQGLLYGFGASLRFTLILIIGLIFLSCVSTEEISLGLVRLKVPYSVAFTIAMAMRLLPTFVSTGKTVIEAQRARGFEARGKNPVRRLIEAFPLVIPITMYGLRQASRMSLALEGRGFRPGARRTSLADPDFGLADALSLAVIFALIAACVTLRLSGHGAVIANRL